MSRKRPAPSDPLTRRERQIMDIVYASGQATAKEIEEGMPDAPAHATVRTLLRVLLDKGHLKYRQEGRAFVYYGSSTGLSTTPTALRMMLTRLIQILDTL